MKQPIFILFPLVLWACAEVDSKSTNQEDVVDVAEEETIDTETEFEEQESSEEKLDEDFDSEKEESEDTEGEETSGEEKEEADYEECPEDVDSASACEGTWEDTICISEDLIWWCQDGVWMNESEK